jgi:hypothetical protein
VGDDEMTPTECWERCMYGDACRTVLCRVTDRYYSGSEAATIMECAQCEMWEE